MTAQDNIVALIERKLRVIMIGKPRGQTGSQAYMNGDAGVWHLSFTIFIGKLKMGMIIESMNQVGS